MSGKDQFRIAVGNGASASAGMLGTVSGIVFVHSFKKSAAADTVKLGAHHLEHQRTQCDELTRIETGLTDASPAEQAPLYESIFPAEAISARLQTMAHPTIVYDRLAQLPESAATLQLKEMLDKREWTWSAHPFESATSKNLMDAAIASGLLQEVTGIDRVHADGVRQRLATKRGVRADQIPERDMPGAVIYEIAEAKALQQELEWTHYKLLDGQAKKFQRAGIAAGAGAFFSAAVALELGAQLMCEGRGLWQILQTQTCN